MSKLKNLVGQRFGRLTVLERAGSNNCGNATWLCQCDCGKQTIVSGNNLRHEHTKSCGCIATEKIRAAKIIHGQHNTRLYRIWCNMKDRCNNSKSASYINYGWRGVTVCDEWQNSFVAFRDWALAAGYNDALTIDRIDANGNYEPNNCRWATQKEQQNNRRNNNFLEYKGQIKTRQEWAEKLSIPYGTLRSRLRRGWSVEKALTTPVDERMSRKTK